MERALTKVEQQYISLYKQVQFFNSTCGDKGVDLTYFEKPLGLIKEEIGMVISEDVMLQVLSCYHYMKMSVEEILQEVQLKREDVENIIKTYKIDKKNNRYILEKNI